MIRKDLIFPILVLAATLVGAAILVLRGKELATNLQTQVYDLLVQLVFITGIGGLVTLATTEFTRARDQRRQERELVRQAFSDLVELYNEVKRVRRLLRAKAIQKKPDDGERLVDRDQYDSLLLRLNDAQLQLEFYVRYARGNKDIFGPASPVLVACIKSAEEYIGQVISEWEKNLSAFSGVPAAKPLKDLPCLDQFIDDASTGFGPQVADPIGDVLTALASVIAV